MSSTPQPPFTGERLSMVEQQLRRRDIHDERVLAAMNRVPRHEFVLPKDWPEAYADRPIAIAEHQTTSQPYMIA
ncbi:MAG TPA: protein-L-isoaspartate O-methyltransferase, partial [Candidatus Angelobacter sp.]|nr:protein-L-isoaspartate O-methyltransferase [Candidatus Angelobacter sp.]